MVYVRFYDLLNEINATLEWMSPSNKRRTKLVSEINKRRDIQSNKYGMYFNVI